MKHYSFIIVMFFAFNSSLINSSEHGEPGGEDVVEQEQQPVDPIISVEEARLRDEQSRQQLESARLGSSAKKPASGSSLGKKPPVGVLTKLPAATQEKDDPTADDFRDRTVDGDDAITLSDATEKSPTPSRILSRLKRLFGPEVRETTVASAAQSLSMSQKEFVAATDRGQIDLLNSDLRSATVTSREITRAVAQLPEEIAGQDSIAGLKDMSKEQQKKVNKQVPSVMSKIRNIREFLKAENFKLSLIVVGKGLGSGMYWVIRGAGKVFIGVAKPVVAVAVCLSRFTPVRIAAFIAVAIVFFPVTTFVAASFVYLALSRIRGSR